MNRSICKKAGSSNARLRGNRGLATVEFAIAAPVLCLLVLAAAELGRAFVQHTILSYAVREGARYVSQNSVDGNTGVVGITATAATSGKNVVVYGNIAGTGSPRLPGFATSQVTVTSSLNNVSVVATYPYTPMVGSRLPTFGFGAPISLTFSMKVAVVMRGIS
jgi:Flp pilus assembly protein TadG